MFFRTFNLDSLYRTLFIRLGQKVPVLWPTGVGHLLRHQRNTGSRGSLARFCEIHCLKSKLLCATSRSYLEGDLLHGPFRHLHIAWSVQPDADAAADRKAEALFKAFCVVGDP